MNESLHWYALYTRTNCEKKVSGVLEKKGIVHYCPLNKVMVKDGSQKKLMIAPLFPSIIFAQVPANESVTALTRLPNVINLLYRHRQPAVFPAMEIESLRNFLDTHETVTTNKTGIGVPIATKPQDATAFNYSMTDKVYTLELPSIGYILSAIVKPINNIKLVGKNSIRYRTTEKLAFILGLKNSNKFHKSY
jgi:transcription antitermination factor NusG